MILTELSKFVVENNQVLYKLNVQKVRNVENRITMKKMLGINAQMFEAYGFLSSIRPCWWNNLRTYVCKY